MLTTAIPIDSL